MGVCGGGGGGGGGGGIRGSLEIPLYLANTCLMNEGVYYMLKTLKGLLS